MIGYSIIFSFLKIPRLVFVANDTCRFSQTGKVRRAGIRWPVTESRSAPCVFESPAVLLPTQLSPVGNVDVVAFEEAVLPHPRVVHVGYARRPQAPLHAPDDPAADSDAALRQIRRRHLRRTAAPRIGKQVVAVERLAPSLSEIVGRGASGSVRVSRIRAEGDGWGCIAVCGKQASELNWLVASYFDKLSRGVFGNLQVCKSVRITCENGIDAVC